MTKERIEELEAKLKSLSSDVVWLKAELGIAKAAREAKKPIARKLRENEDCWVIYGDGEIGSSGADIDFLGQGNALFTEADAELIKLRREMMVPIHPMPKNGKKFWVMNIESTRPVEYEWTGLSWQRFYYNVGLTGPTKQSVEARRNDLLKVWMCGDVYWKEVE